MRLLNLIQIVSVKCSLSARWAPAAVTPAPAAAGFGDEKGVRLRILILTEAVV